MTVNISVVPFFWPVAGTKSASIDLEGRNLCGIYIPSTFSGTSISFEVSEARIGTYVPLEDETSTVISATVAASTYCRLKPADFAGVQFIRIVSGASEAAGRVVNAAAREMQ